MGDLRLARPVATGVAVVVRPDLWATAGRLARRVAVRGWWHHWPARPLPPAPYLRFRSETMLGSGAAAALAPEDVIAYLEWCRRMHALGR